MKKILKYIVIIFLLLLIPAALLTVPIGNNIILNKHTNDLKNIKLNATYKVLATDSTCGKLIGNGNGMQYLSALLIHSKEDLQSENSEEEGVHLINVNDPSFEDLINGYDFHGDYFENINNKIKEINTNENNYVLYSFYNAPLDCIWNIDLRAH